MYDAWCMMYDVWCMMYDVWCMMYDVWCMMYDVWCMMYVVWCVMYDIWCMMYGVWCMMYVWKETNHNLNKAKEFVHKYCEARNSQKKLRKQLKLSQQLQRRGVNKVWCMMYDVWCMMYDVGCMMYDVWCIDVWCMMYDVWWMMCDVCSMMYDVWWMMYECMMYDVWCMMLCSWNPCTKLITRKWKICNGRQTNGKNDTYNYRPLETYDGCVMYDVWCLMCDVWCIMYDVWCMMYDVWCMMYDVWERMNWIAYCQNFTSQTCMCAHSALTYTHCTIGCKRENNNFNNIKMIL